MTLEELAKLVRASIDARQRWYVSPDHANAAAAARLNCKVEDAIADILDNPKEAQK